jgi:hypothetical protein
MNTTVYGTLKELEHEQILEAIEDQIPDGEYVRDYNCAVTGELRIIVRRQGYEHEQRYVVYDRGYIELRLKN